MHHFFINIDTDILHNIPIYEFIVVEFNCNSFKQQVVIFDLAVTEAFMEPAKYPGSSGTRNLSDNLSDLKAQVAANQKVHACTCNLNIVK